MCAQTHIRLRVHCILLQQGPKHLAEAQALQSESQVCVTADACAHRPPAAPSADAGNPFSACMYVLMCMHSACAHAYIYTYRCVCVCVCVCVHHHTSTVPSVTSRCFSYPFRATHPPSSLSFLLLLLSFLLLLLLLLLLLPLRFVRHENVHGQLRRRLCARRNHFVFAVRGALGQRGCRAVWRRLVCCVRACARVCQRWETGREEGRGGGEKEMSMRACACVWT